MANKLQILKDELSDNLMTVCSWGIRDFAVSEHNIVFSVDGIKYKGDIILSFDNNVYKAALLNNDVVIYAGTAKSLIRLVDKAIESSDTYKEDITRWFNENME